VILSAYVQHGNESDVHTLLYSIGPAQGNYQKTPSNAEIEKAVTDKVTIRNETLAQF